MGRILVVDDEPFNREIFERMFESMGYDVKTAESWLAGSEMFHPGRFDLVCLDVVMPGVDGFVAAREIRGIDPTQRIVMLTGLGRDLAEERSVAHGVDVDDFIFKPFTYEGVETIVRRVMEEGARQGIPSLS